MVNQAFIMFCLDGVHWNSLEKIGRFDLKVCIWYFIVKFEHLFPTLIEELKLTMNPGLTISRKPAKNLAFRRKSWQILTVSCKKIFPVKTMQKW